MLSRSSKAKSGAASPAVEAEYIHSGSSGTGDSGFDLDGSGLSLGCVLGFRRFNLGGVDTPEGFTG